MPKDQTKTRLQSAAPSLLAPLLLSAPAHTMVDAADCITMLDSGL